MMEAVDPWNTVCSVGTVSQHHEHASDDDEEENHRTIRRSFSDEYDSRRSEYGVQHLNQDLIHRYAAAQKEGNNNSSNQSQYHHTLVRNGHARQHYSKQRSRRKRWMTWKRIGLVTTVISYIWLMYQGSQKLHHHESIHQDFPPGSRNNVFAARTMMEHARMDQEKRLQSQRRTRPKMTVKEMEEYRFALSDEEPRRPIVKHNRLNFDTATLEELCGSHARNASIMHPKNYVARDALNSKSRVLITGILNPIGFQLALTLKKQCGVEIMTGIDPMFPNTVENRMAMQERIQLLATNIPKMIQPVVIPLVGLDQRRNKEKNISQEILQSTGETSLLNFKPTHIIHLASYSASEHKNGQPDFVNSESPYGGHSDLYRIRANAVSMEQILSSMASTSNETERPHFAYASSATVTSSLDEHARYKLTDEILADTYFNMDEIFSIGVRLPNAVFGPWGRPGTVVYQIAEAAIGQWGGSPQTIFNETDSIYDFSFVDDVLDGIIAAMQYRAPLPIVFDLSSDSTHKLSTVAHVIKELMPGAKVSSNISMDVSHASPLMQRTRSLLQWRPRRSLQTGLAKTMAWHLDLSFPFGGNTTTSETGDKFRNRHQISTCSADDILCHLGPTYLPCASECSTREKCTPSIFDNVHSLVRDVTRECDIVLYTQSLGYNVRDLKLQATFRDEEEVMLCNVAFVPKDSRLVRSVIKKVPEDQLQVLGIHIEPREEETDPDGVKERKLQKLNGRLLYKGWILLWVENATQEISESDRVLLKLSPSSFFSSDVKHAVFVNENLSMSPTPEDIIFLVSQSRRPKLPSRVAWRKEIDGKKHKYRLLAEPERRAALVVSPLKQIASTKSHTLTVYEATKYMQFEDGEDINAKETQGVKRQREFYERVPTFVNRVDMRSPDEAWYRYEAKQWTRSTWVVHDLQLEEGRILRCEWYQEHIQWNNTLDHLSLAHVLAKRELARRIAHKEPDDHIKPAHLQHPELLQLTDSHEWHAMESEENRLALVHPLNALAEVPGHMIDKDEDGMEDLLSLHDDRSKEHTKQAVPLFVRIISERVMMQERERWTQWYAKYKESGAKE
jgi:nucleoside-diphosphate-sugar epimerase